MWMVNGSVGRIASGWGLWATWCVHGVLWVDSGRGLGHGGAVHGW